MRRKTIISTVAVMLAATAGATIGATLGDDAEAQAHHEDQVALTQTKAQLAKVKSDLGQSKRHASDLQTQVDAYEAEAAERWDREHGGFHDPVTLARSIKHEKDKDLRKDGVPTRVKDVSCVAKNTRNTSFVCLVNFKRAYYGVDRMTLKVSVAADGESWISR